MKPPNFFIIGAPKCGTTALSEYLRAHPQVFFSEPKEPHFFNEDFANRHTTTWDDYLAYFADANEAHHAVGEGSVFYLRSQVAVPNILSFTPDARLVVMLRNPVTMAPSLHSETVLSFGESERDFIKAWRLQEQRQRGEAIPKLCREPKLLLYGEMCRLGEQMERLYQHVSPEQVKVIFFDDFVADTSAVYRNVLAFLGLEPTPRQHFERVNTNKTQRSALFDTLAEYLGRGVLAVKRRLNITGHLGLVSKLKTLNTVRTEREPLPPAFIAELKDYFRDDIAQLAELTGRDLSHWTR